ncbi:innexin inx2-like [Tetranychus urticae]|uniref:Innexin n=1 Tax=Tetranychus urticae TaxID=32264 RepID=T1K2R1_TETUR|nr:innexin inx2-like [Tetranychus urticae]
MALNRIPGKVKEILGSFESHSIINKSILGLVNKKWNDYITIDSFLFTFHSKITVLMLTFFMCFLMMKQYFGEPIECLDIPSAAQSISSKQMTNYCWMEGAFTIVTRYSTSDLKRLYEVPGHDVAYPGIKAYKPHQGDLKMPHKYYQWVYYILAIQCLLFYAPKVMWKYRERGRLTELIKHLKMRNSPPPAGFKVESQPQCSSSPGPSSQSDQLDQSSTNYDDIINDAVDTILIADQYYNGIIGAEVLCLVHLVCEIWFIHLFLGGKFFMLGFEWLNYTHNSDDIAFDPLIRIFPRLTKCSFHKFGASGSLETYDTLCFMPMNIVNEKIFVILWFWFLILTVITIYHLFCRLCSHFSVMYRLRALKKVAPCADKDNATTDEVAFFKYMVKVSPGRAFVLHMIAKNLKPICFRRQMELVRKKHFEKDKESKKFRLSCKREIGFISETSD